MTYMIKLKDGFIFVYKINSSKKIETLKNDGEEKFKYDKESFWKWFIEKIEYNPEESQKLCFLISSDSDDFQIENKLKISKVHDFSKQDIQKILSEKNLFENITCYPQIKEDINKEFEEGKPKSVKDGTLQDYYTNKTLRHKYGK